MAALKRTLDGKQRLEPLLQKLKGRGVSLRGFIQNFVMAGIGLVASAFGLLLTTTGTLMMVSPEVARTSSLCRGDPVSNLVVGVFALVSGLILLALYRQLPKSILIVDHGVVLQYRSGHERVIAWYEIDSCFDWTIAMRFLRLKSGKIFAIPSGKWPAWHDFSLLLTFNAWLGNIINPESPLMSVAFKEFKSKVISQGVQVPAKFGLQHNNTQRLIHIFSSIMLVSLVLSISGWLGEVGVLLGLAPIFFGLLLAAVFHKPVKPSDHISMNSRSLLVETAHVEDLSFNYADTKHWGIGPMELSISFNDKRHSCTIAIGATNATMMIETARMATQLPPIRVVETRSTLKIA